MNIIIHIVHRTRSIGAALISVYRKIVECRRFFRATWENIKIWLKVFSFSYI